MQSGRLCQSRADDYVVRETGAARMTTSSIRKAEKRFDSVKAERADGVIHPSALDYVEAVKWRSDLTSPPGRPLCGRHPLCGYPPGLCPDG